MTAPTQLTCEYETLFNEIAVDQFGIRPISPATLAVVSANQSSDILRCISAGLKFVYSAHPWSFLRSRVTITTYPAYTTGTITVDAAGTVTGVDTVFPAYAATAGGWLDIPCVGSYAVATRTGDTELTLTGFPAASVFTTASTYTLSFDTYPITSASVATVDTLEGPMTFQQGSVGFPADILEKVYEVKIRQLLARNANPGRPLMYAETTTAFDPTVGSTRSVVFYPVPDAEYVLTAIGVLRPSMIDSSNKYPLGIEVLAPCLIESCLAAAERLIEKKDAGHPDAVHNRALIPLLQMAIKQDKENTSPDTLGVDHGQGDDGEHRFRPRGSSYYWDAGGYTGYF